MSLLAQQRKLAIQANNSKESLQYKQTIFEREEREFNVILTCFLYIQNHIVLKNSPKITAFELRLKNCC